MALVRRANVYLEVADEEIERFLHLGYDVIDQKTGKIIQEAIPQDVGTLRLAYVTYKKKIEAYEKQIKELEEKIKALEKKPVTKKKA